jgi:hypothetical protein
MGMQMAAATAAKTTTVTATISTHYYLSNYLVITLVSQSYILASHVSATTID